MRYLIHFLYVSWYWDVRLACFIVWHEIKGEKRYGIRTIGTDNLKSSVAAADRAHATMYEPVNYYTADTLLRHVTEEELHTAFLDVGCGKGRVLAMAQALGFREVIGIELSPKLCADAQAIPLVTVHCVNAKDYVVPDNVGVIFLFNPFDETVMAAFIENVRKSVQRKKRPLKILYANPVCKQLWLDAGFRETVAFVKFTYLQGSVLESENFA